MVWKSDASADRKGEGDEQRQHHQKEAGLHSFVFLVERGEEVEDVAVLGSSDPRGVRWVDGQPCAIQLRVNRLRFRVQMPPRFGERDQTSVLSLQGPSPAELLFCADAEPRQARGLAHARHGFSKRLVAVSVLARVRHAVRGV